MSTYPTDPGLKKPGHNPLVHDHPAPLRIVIFGAGIDGLSAAIALSRQGHRIEVYEQPWDQQETGAVVHLTPNVNGLLRRWGIFAETIGAIDVSGLVEYASTGEEQRVTDLTGSNKMWQHPWQLVQHFPLHNKLRDMVVKDGGQGIPSVLHKSVTVTNADPETGRILLADGTPIEADVIIAADGIFSKIREFIDGGNTKLFNSGKVAFNFLVPRKAAMDGPITCPLADQPNTVCTWYGDDKRAVMSPYDENGTLSFLIVQPDNDVQFNGWNKTVLIDQVLDICQGFEPALKSLISKADPAESRGWQQMDMDKLPTWTKGRLAVLGDAAHPFPAYSSDGVGQAIEDAAALATVFPAGTAPSDVPERLELYEKIRYDRAHRIQAYAKQAGEGLADRRNTSENASLNYNFGHDEVDNSTIIFKKWLWSKKRDIYWRMPTAFGPSPGPRLDHLGRPRGGHGERKFETAFVMFKTSRTYLESLLPTDSFHFKSPATIGYASIIITTLDNMSWLGGGGYTHCGLYLHDVEYTKRDGTTVYGTYLPVLFENLTDPIISGRDELGWNKVYCEIDIVRTPDSYHAKLSWRGAKFLDVKLDDLTVEPPKIEGLPADAAKDYGVLTYKYIPVTGEPGKADVEYACVTPHAEEAKIAQATAHSVVWSQKPKLEFEAKDWISLPTLHHISSGLAAIPIYEIIFAKVTEGVGVSDMTSCRRIE